MAVRPTRRAWASLWLTQIIARWASWSSHWSINCSTAAAVAPSRAAVGSSIRCYPSQRIRWRCIEQHARARRNGSFDEIPIDLVAAVAQRLWNRHRFRVRHGHDRAAVGPGRRQDQCFIPRIEHAPDGDVQRLHARNGDHDFARGIKGHAVVPDVVIAQFFPQRQQASVGRVESKAIRQRLLRRFFNEARRRLIRLAKIKRQNIPHPERNIGQFADAGVRNSFRGMREFRLHLI